MACDPELAKSAQEWTDEQARAGNMYHSEWTDKFTESISWKGWGWEGMEKMEGAIPGATRSWYSEIKNDYDYATGKGNGQAVGHFMAVVWKGETKIGCGLNIKPDDGTYVTAHYAPASHANVDYFELAPKNVLPRKDPGRNTSHLSTYGWQQISLFSGDELSLGTDEHISTRPFTSKKVTETVGKEM